ncbi:MAG: TatD family hydrolase [Patescibacteria group bacterium]
MLIDTHAHLNFKAFDEDRQAVMARCQQAGMKLINVGAAQATSQKAVELADGQNFYAALALHPIHIYDEDFSEKQFQALIDKNKNKIVAIGETGLDYWHLSESIEKGAESIAAIKQKQRLIFKAHIRLAKENNLPLIIHCRFSPDEPRAYDDVYDVLQEEGVDRGVIHCYVGDLAGAKKFIDLGFYLGFNGIITFDKSGVLEDIIKWIPKERILIETDCPWLTPVPFRGKRNEPLYVQYVAEKIAQIKRKNSEEIIKITGDNAKKLFNI